MKFYLVVDEDKEESVVLTCKKVTSAVKKIQDLCSELSSDEELLYGYQDSEIIPLEINRVDCFYTKENKVFAKVESEEYLLKLRLKQIAEMVDDSFIKINQGCIVKTDSIKNFAASFGGSLKVVLKNGYCDFVSRREITNIKRRFGL